MRRAVYAAVLLLLASIVCSSPSASPWGCRRDAHEPLQYRDQTREELEARLGLDKPLVVQYGLFVKNVLTGDIGHSLVSGRRITTVIVEAGKNTAILAAAAAFLTYMISIPLGALAAWRRNSSLDHGDHGSRGPRDGYSELLSCPIAHSGFCCENLDGCPPPGPRVSTR